jgi:hypothetical protein
MKNKNLFFQNCIHWLKPGGYLIIHLVEPDNFDTILPAVRPFHLMSPQKNSSERPTQTRVSFNNMEYIANFLLNGGSNIATFEEKFKNIDTGKVRKNEHTLYMESDENILTIAQTNGFLVQGKIDLASVSQNNQYLYILIKPN